MHLDIWDQSHRNKCISFHFLLHGRQHSSGSLNFGEDAKKHDMYKFSAASFYDYKFITGQGATCPLASIPTKTTIILIKFKFKSILVITSSDKV